MKDTTQAVKVTEVKEVLNSLGFNAGTDQYFYRGALNHPASPEISVRASRMENYQTSISSMIVDIGFVSQRRGRVFSAWKRSVDLCKPTWREDLKAAFEKAKGEPLAVYRAKREESNAQTVRRQAAHEAFRAELMQFTGKYVANIISGDGGMPVGIRIDLNVFGTPKEIVAKVEAIQALAAAMANGGAR